MDDMLPMTLVDFVSITALVLSIVILICVVNWWVVLAVLPLVLYFFRVRSYYLRTAREVKRIEAVRPSRIVPRWHAPH